METMGRYELKGELGRGGMAVVYRAVDPHIGREVAVKVLPREFLQDGDFLARFQREVRTIGQLNHAAIVPLHDAGEDKGQPYLVMRLMHGGSLLDRLKRGAIPVAETATMFSRLAGALDEAHGKGIIHRDLKPGNILLDEQGQPYLSDFGIAKLTEATSMNSRGVIGTPAYMSPEHFEGKVSAQSDVYAMGIILFQMLTGRLPFQAATPPEYMKAHFMDTPPPLRSINPHLPVELESVLQKALAKSKEQRFKTVGELARALGEAVSLSASQRSAGQPVSQSVGQRSASQTVSPQVEDEPTVLGGNGLVSQLASHQAASQPVSEPVSKPTRNVRWWRLMVALGLGIMLGCACCVFMGTRDLSSALPVMVVIPAGEFTMGSDTGRSDEKPAHKVYLAEYFIDKYEITNAQYAECVAAGKCSVPKCDEYKKAAKVNHPVVCVDWTQAKSYCEFAGKRLPTEAEWEKAARGTDGRTYPWGNVYPNIELLNYGGHVGDTMEVGSYPKGVSSYGVMDMAGNVWEWTSSQYKGYPYNKDDGRENLLSDNSKVGRGGSWEHIEVNLVSASARLNPDPTLVNNISGFRCAR